MRSYWSGRTAYPRLLLGHSQGSSEELAADIEEQLMTGSIYGGAAQDWQ